MKASAVSLLAGLLFGAGLTVTGMADPMRVRAFLDFMAQTIERVRPTLEGEEAAVDPLAPFVIDDVIEIVV